MYKVRFQQIPGLILFLLFLAGANAQTLASAPHASRASAAQPTAPRVPQSPFRVLVMASRVQDHEKMIDAARPIFGQMATQNHFDLDFTDDTSLINDINLTRYQVFVMLQLAPFDMSYGQQEALQRFVARGGGFVGIHAAGLTGKQFILPTTRYWTWFEELMGGVLYSSHPPFQKATVVIEDHKHPVTRHLPATFPLSDEFYEFDHSPRNNVHVLASVDEHSYHPNKPTGDHPIVWTNQQFRRMIYIAMGAYPSLLEDTNYRILLRDAIRWAASPSNYMPPVSTRNGKVYYQRTFPYPASISRQEAYRRALQWFNQTACGADKSVYVKDPEAGIVAGTALFDVATGPEAGPGAIAGPAGFTGAPSNHYQIRCELGIRVTDSGYVFTASHYADKATDQGITHDFTKVEYRWWDYHAGNPWSAADQPLFEALHAHTLTLLNSFKADIAVVSGRPPRFKALALYENGGHHVEYSARAGKWLDSLSLDSNFRVDYITNTDSIDDAYLSKYQLIIQLDYAPYAWRPAAVSAFQHYIDEGRGGWVGFHHASLLGEFDGYPMWSWFSTFMGGIRWKDYIARFARAEVHVENHSNPVMAGIPDSFPVQKEEWYTYDKSPRPNVEVLAHVDESSYFPDTAVKMGDHPVIWTNPHVKARNVYIFMGHSPILFDDAVYTRIFRNAIFWASASPANPTSPPTHELRQGFVPRPSSFVPFASLRYPSSIGRSRGLSPFKALAFYTTTVEPDHVDFAGDAIRFYSRLAAEKGNFILDTTSDWSNMNPDKLRQYQVVLWLNDFPQNAVQRTAFEQYIDSGGAWLGFHVSAYNDSYTRWPWFVQFLGGAVFKDNSWPPLTARLLVDDTVHPVTLGLPGKYIGPVNEWYRWSPDPRANKDVKVLVTLDPRQYPLGKKDRIRSGDVPVVWTNTRYKMLYMNMGHGDGVFNSPIQNKLFENAILWLGAGAAIPRR